MNWEELFGKKKVSGDVHQKQKPYLLYPIPVPTEMHLKLNLCNFQANTIIVYTKKNFLFLESIVLNGKRMERSQGTLSKS